MFFLLISIQFKWQNSVVATTPKTFYPSDIPNEILASYRAIISSYSSVGTVLRWLGKAFVLSMIPMNRLPPVQAGELIQPMYSVGIDFLSAQGGVEENTAKAWLKVVLKLIQSR